MYYVMIILRFEPVNSHKIGSVVMLTNKIKCKIELIDMIANYLFYLQISYSFFF